jgi:chorismate synthase
MKIILAGPKAVGKSIIGSQLADMIGIPFYETDDEIIRIYKEETGLGCTCRDISHREGAQRFRDLERQAVKNLASKDWCVIATGGSTLLNAESRRLMRQNGIVVLLTAPGFVLWSRAAKDGIPAYLVSENPNEEFSSRVFTILEALRPYADVEVDTTSGDWQKLAKVTMDGIANELSLRSQAPNTFGDVVRVSTFGESHGPAIGCIIDGVKPGFDISEEDIQQELDRRRPGQSDVSTPRKERDKVRILSGIFDNKTTGAPICLVLMSEDQRPSAYEGIKNLFRPGHADFTFWKKYGIRDYRGGGRSSGRETAGRVAGGAVVKRILADRGVTISAYALEIGGIKAESIDLSVIEDNPVRCPDMAAAGKMEEAILAVKEKGDSLGGVIELRIQGVPPGLGDPVFGKLDARLARALLSIGATKGFEIGTGFEAARKKGSENNDAMQDGEFLTNNAGGIIGGISNGNEIVIRLAVKPTSSISLAQNTIDTEGKNREILVEGRHDPCIVPRVVPVVESMAALVLLDTWEIQDRIRPGWDQDDG